MNGCRKCPAFDKCTVYEYRGSQCAAFRSTYGIESDPEIITNGDRIREMSDEELAETIVDADWCEICCHYYNGTCNATGFEKPLYQFCVEGCLKWLQQPAGEDKHGTETD